MRAFAQADRFVSEVEARKLRPVYVFVGDEAFFRKRCRDAILHSLVPNDLREFSLYEFDLADTDLAEVLDRARTPSLMAPFQVFFVRGVKNLFGRGSNEDKIKAIADMSGRILGIKLGSPGETLKLKLDAQLKAERGAGFKDVKTYDDHPAAYLALAQGSVDGVLNTVPTLAVVMRDKPGAFAMVTNVGGDNWHGYAFRKEDTELAEFINSRITAMKQNGEMYELQEKWFGFRMRLSDSIPTFS